MRIENLSIIYASITCDVNDGNGSYEDGVSFFNSFKLISGRNNIRSGNSLCCISDNWEELNCYILIRLFSSFRFVSGLPNYGYSSTLNMALEPVNIKYLNNSS